METVPLLMQASLPLAYPFDPNVSFTVHASATVPLRLRIPGWCTTATVQLITNGGVGRPAAVGTMHQIILPAGHSKVELLLPMPPRLVPTGAGDGSVVVMRGPIVIHSASTYSRYSRPRHVVR